MFGQIVEILMEINCAPLIADYIWYCYLYVWQNIKTTLLSTDCLAYAAIIAET